MQRPRDRLARTAGAAVLALASVAWAIWLWWPGLPIDTPPAVHAHRVPAPAGPLVLPLRSPRGTEPSVHAQKPAPSNIEALVDSGDPSALLAAYRWSRYCDPSAPPRLPAYPSRSDFGAPPPSRVSIWVGAGWHYTSVFRAIANPEPTFSCSGITRRHHVARIGWLRKAAAAGVPGASILYATAGAFEDIGAVRQRPQDPLVQAWFAEAIEWIERDLASGQIDFLPGTVRWLEATLPADWETAELQRIADRMSRKVVEGVRNSLALTGVTELTMVDAEWPARADVPTIGPVMCGRMWMVYPDGTVTTRTRAPRPVLRSGGRSAYQMMVAMREFPNPCPGE